MTALIFTPFDIARIISLRNDGMTQLELSKIFYCSGPTIGRILHENGIFGYHAHKPKYPIGMICHDWNANIPTADIIRKYHLNRTPLRNLLYQYRKNGWKFNKRSGRHVV